jgi:hypothetical protein
MLQLQLRGDVLMTKMQGICGTLSILLACMQCASLAQTYYVDPVNGLDNNSGTSAAAAFKTLGKARDAVKAVNAGMTGDITVYLRGGWHILSSTLSFDQTISGANGHNVIFSAYPGEYPVISGGKQVTGWTLHDAATNIWQATAVAGMGNRQLYVNCVRAVRAHKGSGLPGAVKTANGYTTTDSTMQNWGNKSDIEFVFNALNGGTGGDGSAGWSSKWTERRVGVASIAGTAVTMKQPAWGNATSGDVAQQISKPTDIENAYELLDQPGEWYLNSSAGVVYYIPRVGEDMTNAVVVAPVLQTLVSAVGALGAPVHNVQFKDITFAHATWLGPSGNDGFPELQANYCIGFGWTPGNIELKTVQNLRFERCIFKHLGAIGLNFEAGAQSNIVIGCVFTDISGDCIKIGSIDDPSRNDLRARDTGNQVVDCYLHDAPCEYRGGVGIFCGYVSSVLASRNEINNVPYIGISCGWGWGTASYAQNNQFSYNHVRNFCMSLGDGSGIYTLSSQPNTRWNNNWFDSMPYRDVGGAFYPDEGSANMEIDHDVCSNIGNRWLYIWTSSIHDMSFHDIWSDTASAVNNGVNCPVSNLTIVTGGNWPQAARDIMTNAGLESAYLSITNASCACSLSRPDGSPVGTTPHGVPYSWLSIYGVTVNQAQAETNDPDGDGVPTWKEYYAGTDPNAKSSAFKVLGLSTNRNITWYGTTNSGVTNGFRMYRSTNLLSGSWQLVASNLTRTASGTNTWMDSLPPPSPRIFYRHAIPITAQ